MKAREVKRQKMVKKYAAKRKALKEAGDWEGLQKLPKNASPVLLEFRAFCSARWPTKALFQECVKHLGKNRVFLFKKKSINWLKVPKGKPHPQIQINEYRSNFRLSNKD